MSVSVSGGLRSMGAAGRTLGAGSKVGLIARLVLVQAASKELAGG